MRCPMCGGYSIQVTKTIQKSKSVYRYRKCHNCDFTFPTEERAKYEAEYAAVNSAKIPVE